MREPDDPGIAVYFDRLDSRGKLRPYAMACETYMKVTENMRGMVNTIDALNTIDRHGASEILEQAISSFLQLPEAATAEQWWRALGCDENADMAMVKDRFRAMTQTEHPDQGGDEAKMARINMAYSAAKNAIAARR